MDSVEALVEGFLPKGVRIAAATVADHVSGLLPEERVAIERAVPSRQHEFSTGRMLARRVLSQFGHADFPVIRDPDRVPLWPEGLVGSITHSGSLCVAAVGSAARYQGIGLDCEPDQPVKEDVARIVCRGEEHDWVAAAGEGERGRRCRMIFSVKEAVYKAFYPRTRVFWSFQDVTVSIDLEQGAYRARLPESAWVAECEGRIRIRDGWILSATVLG